MSHVTLCLRIFLYQSMTLGFRVTQIKKFKRKNVGYVDYFLFFSVTDGKDSVGKEIIEDIDEEKQSVRFKLIEGDLMEIYKSMYITYHVDTNGPDNLVTWTLEYEKFKEEYPHPGTLLNFFLHMVEDIEGHHHS